MVTHEQAEERVKTGFYIHLAVYATVIAGLMALNFTRHPERLWSVWVAGGWGLGVVAHGMGVFLSSTSRERMVQRTMQRIERRTQRQAHSH